MENKNLESDIEKELKILHKSIPKDKSLSITYPHIASQWHPTKNGDLTPDNVIFGTHKKVWWKCENGHEWQAEVWSRTQQKTNCPYCSNKKVCIDNCLATVRPDLASQWHPTKNEDLTPDSVMYGTQKKIWWQCEKGHEWEAKVDDRTRGNGCPYCSSRKLCKDNSLASLYPKIAEQWNYEKNEGLTPDDVFSKTNRKVWWKCEKGHEWERSVQAHTIAKGCPYCLGEIASPEICLASRYPELLSEWDYEKNKDISPYELTYGSEKKVWWKCKYGHEWKSSPNGRTSPRVKSCPHCNKERRTSFPEQTIYYYIKKIFNNAVNGFRLPVNQRMEADIYISPLNIAIEYDGDVFHNDKKVQSDENKNRIFKEENIKLIRVREENCPDIEMYGHHLIKSTSSSGSDYLYLNDVVKQIFNYILETENLSPLIISNIHSVKIDVLKDRNEIKSLYLKREKENSIANLYPALISEWHPVKNLPVTPDMVSAKSGKKFWWICKDGHEWEAVVGSRTNGCGCPYCSGRQPTLQNNLEVICPEIAGQWHPTKNGILRPIDFAPRSGISVWWKGKCGHEWKASIYNRTNGCGCPYCANQKVDECNSLADLKPELAKQWHPSKNGNLTPKDLTKNSRQKVWWQCEKGHEWESTVDNRAKGKGCPYCGNKKVCKDNSLASLYPKIAEQWDYRKNEGLTPHDVVPHSQKKVWWKCSKCGHEWDAIIYTRVISKADSMGCASCASKTAIANNNLAIEKPEYVNEWHPEKNGELTPYDVAPGSERNVWWKCSKCGKEYQTSVRSKTRNGYLHCPECTKKEIWIIKKQKADN